MDGWVLRMVEAATHAGYPVDAGAVLLIEVEGLREEVEEQAEAIRQVCRKQKAREVRRARDERERQLLWSGRKNAAGAVGRFSPKYYTQDGVIPRTRVPQALRQIEAMAKKYSLTIGNIMHAGDGNLHPIICFDPRDADHKRRAMQASDEIIAYCVSVGGSITGEHGVGMEKMELMAHLFPDESLEMIRRFKNLFDPQCRLNPGKVLPTGKGCLEIRQPAGMTL